MAPAPEVCPNCGAEVPAGAKACPACGSDEETGWSEEAAVGHLDLPDSDFKYEEYVQREFGSKSPVPQGVHWFWWLVGLLVLFAILWFWVL